ncbi:MAG: histone deacetylase [FCB group bacterium]|nr:histone deacetylase [FCB group bacterium]
MVGFIHHDLFLKHLEGFPHSERPERLTAIFDRIKNSSVNQSLKFIEAQPAEIRWLERVHDADYVNDILTLKTDDAVILDWGDTIATSATPQAALHAAGAGVQAVRLVLEGKLSSAFCAVRPPGHHALHDQVMGFCLFNNIAVTAAALVEDLGLERVAIVDFDVHHGNGTERAFIKDDRVLFVSLHQYPYYPGTGAADIVGDGQGRGYNLNIPMASGSGDEDYTQAFNEKVIPALDDFKPEFILISAGFDAHQNDPLAFINLSSQMFGTMTAMLRECADCHCDGRIVSFLEGGYDLDALAEGVEEHLKALT